MYNHYNHADLLILVNKRLDEWVEEDRMNLAKLEPPKKEAKTPLKDGKMLNGSRPNSPDKEISVSGQITSLQLHIYVLTLHKLRAYKV